MLHYKGNIISSPELGKIFTIITTVLTLTIDLIKKIMKQLHWKNGQNKSAKSSSFTAGSQEFISNSEKSIQKHMI